MERSVLVVAPHPDDEVLGCGGVIGKFSSRGERVYILIVSRGRKGKYSEDSILKVRNDALRAHKILGVAESRFLDFPAPDLDIIPLAEISEAIFGIIQELKIDTLFLPHRGDIHHDHKVVFSAGLVASRPIGGNTIKQVFTYETLSETNWAAPFPDDAFIPDHFVDIEKFFSFKMDAISCFTGQVRDFPHSRSIEALEALAKLRGATVGLRKAEAFMTIRTIDY